MTAAPARSFACIACLMFSACATHPEPAAPSEAPPRPSGVRVAVVAAARAELETSLSLTAEFRADQEVDVMAKVGGYLQKIEVDAGSRVEQGQLLATIEVPEMADELARNTAAIARSQADLDRARQEVKRAETAREMTQLSFSRLSAVMEKRPGLVAQQEVDTLRNRDMLAQSQIASAQSSLNASEQSVHMLEAEAARLKTMQAYTRVTAPFAGVVTRRYADTGALIQAGASSQGRPIVRIAQTGKLRLILPVPEASVPRLRPGMLVEVRVDALSRMFTGRLARFTHQIASATRTMETEVDVPNAGGVLVPGMFAEAHIKLDRKQALSVPIEAVDRDRESDSVLVVTPANAIERRQVDLGMETEDRVEISSGLSEGDLVIVGNRSQLRPGQAADPMRVDTGANATSKGRT